MIWPLARGQVVRADINLDEPRLFVVVSNNRRNTHLGDVLGARLTTSRKPSIPTIVELGRQEAFSGRVVCDDILSLFEDEILAVAGVLSASAMREVNLGLAAALGLAD